MNTHALELKVGESTVLFSVNPDGTLTHKYSSARIKKLFRKGTTYTHAQVQELIADPNKARKPDILDFLDAIRFPNTAQIVPMAWVQDRHISARLERFRSLAHIRRFLKAHPDMFPMTPDEAKRFYNDHSAYTNVIKFSPTKIGYNYDYDSTKHGKQTNLIDLHRHDISYDITTGKFRVGEQLFDTFDHAVSEANAAMERTKSAKVLVISHNNLDFIIHDGSYVGGLLHIKNPFTNDHDANRWVVVNGPAVILEKDADLGFYEKRRTAILGGISSDAAAKRDFLKNIAETPRPTPEQISRLMRSHAYGDIFNRILIYEKVRWIHPKG